MQPLFIENIRIALHSIRSHMLRTVLTVMIIAFGIMALVGILTAIDSIKYFLNSNFTMMGANSFTIRNRTMVIHTGNSSTKPRYFPAITFDEATAFKNEYNFPAITSIYTWASQNVTVKFENEKTNPNIAVLGTDENYISNAGLEIEKGRNFSPHELTNASNSVILGGEVANKLFKNNKDPIGKIVSIGPGKYLVIGVLKSKGVGMGFSSDRNCIIPLNNQRLMFPRANASCIISVLAKNTQDVDPALGEATGLFRKIRGLPVYKEDDFDITKSDNIANMLMDDIKYVSLAATIIGIITLIGAAIGLMNIMLVSVTERTREIGIRKAMGANRRLIRNQFLVEAIVIGQLGGILGIVFGILIGNVISILIKSAFIIPWVWIFIGVMVCFIVAIVSGFYPANKAANLDPIEALRYE